MIHDVSTALTEVLVTAIPTDKALGRADVDAADIPQSIRDYMLAVMEQQAERVAADINRVRDPWVAESAEVSRARTALGIAMSRSVHIPASEVESVLNEAAENVMAYLVRPTRTLNRHLLRAEEEEIDVDELQERLHRFTAYPYFAEVLQHYFAEKEVVRVDRSRLGALLPRIDRQMTSDFEPDEWADVLEPLFETLAYIPAFESGVPAQLIQTFFRDKEAGRQLAQIESYDAGTIITRDEIIDLLSSPKRREEAMPLPGPAAPAPRPAAPAPPRPAETEAPTPSAPQRNPDEPLPLWMQFQKQPVEQASNPHADSAPKPIWQQFQAEPSAPAAAAYPAQHDSPEESRPGLDAVERLVLGERGAKHRTMFVRRIFQGSEADYHTSLEALAEAGSWHEASRVIAERIFRRFDVNIYDDAAVTFTNTVEQRFAQRRRF